MGGLSTRFPTGQLGNNMGGPRWGQAPCGGQPTVNSLFGAGPTSR